LISCGSGFIRESFAEFNEKMARKINNLELKKSGKICFYLCEFLSSKFNLP